MYEKFSQWLTLLLEKSGFSGSPLIYTKLAILLGILVVLCVVVNYLAKGIILASVRKLIEKTKSTWDNALLEKKVFHALSHLAPALVIYVFAPFIFNNTDFSAGVVKQLHALIIALTSIYVTWVGVKVVLNFLSAVQHLVETSPVYKDKPVESFFQLGRIIVYILGALLVVSIVLNKPIVYLFSALGALTAVIMLVFKDTILGFVASIQISANDMVRLNDWVEFPKYGADGTVSEINLTTVKIRNWDKTISTVPINAFIADAFKNWRGMSDAGGRRIKRSFSIDLNSVKYCTPEMLEHFKKFQIITEYLGERSQEIENHNKEKEVDTSENINGRHLTNIGVFRAYANEYIKNHPMINKEMTHMVRQLQATENGLPLEIYCFCTEKRWVIYEDIIGDIFDHLLAAVPNFELRLFQSPTGSDFSKFLQG